LCSVSVSHALNLGAKTTTVSSSGNHGAATAAYSAKAGLECVIFTMGFAPKTFLTLMQIYGAKVVPVTTSEGRWMLMSRCVRELGWYPTGSYSLPSFTGNPYGLEGYKTIAYEIAVQLRWQVPDYILVPVGGGEGLYGIWKGFKELQQFGLIDNLPKMVSVETACGGPLKNAFDKELDHIERVQTKPTVAFSIGTATTGLHALNAVKESLGYAITVTDEEMMEAQKYLAALEGVYCEPSSAASVAGMAKMTEQGSLDKQTVKVCVITSSGLKDPESTAKVLKRLPSTEPEWSQFKSLMKEVYQLDVSI
jgi:threonine synthase